MAGCAATFRLSGNVGRRARGARGSSVWYLPYRQVANCVGVLAGVGFYKSRGHQGYRQLQLNRIAIVEVLDTHFTVDPGFHPEDGQYAEWVFHV
jgi:hypothetical protein